MLRVHVSFVQFVQALSIVGFGLALAFVPLALVWAFDRAFSVDIIMLWRIAADAWLLGHGVDLHVQLPEIATLEYGSDAAAQPFSVTFWPLGFALLTFFMSFRSGLRLREGAFGMAAEVRERLDAYEGVGQPERIIASVLTWGVVIATVTASALGLVVAWSAGLPIASPSLVQAAIFPGLLVGGGYVLALLWKSRDSLLETVIAWLNLGERWLTIVRAGFASASAIVVTVIGLGAAAVALTFFTHFDTVVALSEGASPTVLGVIVMFLAQLAALPNVILWGSAWMMGVPVQFGDGTSISVFGTTVGPLPQIPMLGAIPASNEPWFLALLIVTAVAVVVLGMFVARSRIPEYDDWWEPAVAAVIGGITSAAVVIALAAASGGAIGPGRMQVTGPDIGQTALFAGIGLTVLTVIGFLGNGAVEFVADYDPEEAAARRAARSGDWIGDDTDVSADGEGATASDELFAETDGSGTESDAEATGESGSNARSADGNRRRTHDEDAAKPPRLSLRDRWLKNASERGHTTDPVFIDDDSVSSSESSRDEQDTEVIEPGDSSGGSTRD